MEEDHGLGKDYSALVTAYNHANDHPYDQKAVVAFKGVESKVMAKHNLTHEELSDILNEHELLQEEEPVLR